MRWQTRHSDASLKWDCFFFSSILFGKKRERKHWDEEEKIWKCYINILSESAALWDYVNLVVINRQPSSSLCPVHSLTHLLVQPQSAEDRVCIRCLESVREQKENVSHSKINQHKPCGCCFFWDQFSSVTSNLTWPLSSLYRVRWPECKNKTFKDQGMSLNKKRFSFILCSCTALVLQPNHLIKLDFEATNMRGGFKFYFQPAKQHRRSQLFRI